MSDSIEYFQNYAGVPDIDDSVEQELVAAGIHVIKMPEGFRDRGEVKTIVVGEMHKWLFRRAWRYWMAEGPGIDVVTAENLHAQFGNEVRVDGHCGCPSPREWFSGLACGHYHIDTPRGLKALADAIKALCEV